MANKQDVANAAQSARLDGMLDALSVIENDYPQAAERVRELALGYSIAVLGYSADIPMPDQDAGDDL